MNNIGIRVVEDDEEFYNLKNDWDRLAQGLTQANSFDWQYKWWNYYKEKHKLKILVAEKDNRVVGIAPLYLQFRNEFRVITFKKLSFLGGDLSDFLDFLIEDGTQRTLIFETLLNYSLERVCCDFVGFGQINSAYPNFHLWQKYSKNLALEFE